MTKTHREKDIFVKASLMRCRVFLLPLSEKALSPGVFCFFLFKRRHVTFFLTAFSPPPPRMLRVKSYSVFLPDLLKLQMFEEKKL